MFSLLEGNKINIFMDDIVGQGFDLKENLDENFISREISQEKTLNKNIINFIKDKKIKTELFKN